MNITLRVLLFTTLLIGSISSAHAYIGPGMGGGVIMAVLGIIGAVFIGLFGVVYFPIKRALKRKKNKAIDDKAKEQDQPDDNDNKQD